MAPGALRGRECRGAHPCPLRWLQSHPSALFLHSEPAGLHRVPCLDTPAVRLKAAAERGPSALGLHASCSWEGSSPLDTRPSEDAAPAACHQAREFPSASKAVISRGRMTVRPRSLGSRDPSACPPCGGESGICRPLSPRPQAAARLPAAARFPTAPTGLASPRGPDVQLPTCSPGCGGPGVAPGSLSSPPRARPCSPLRAGVLAAGTSACGLVRRRALQTRSSPRDVPGGRHPIRQGSCQRGTAGTEPDTQQGGRTWRWGPGRHLGGSVLPSSACSRSDPGPCLVSLPTRVIGSGARSGDALPRGLPPAGSPVRSPVPPGAAWGECRPVACLRRARRPSAACSVLDHLLPEAARPPCPVPGVWDLLSSQGLSLSPLSNQAPGHLPLADAADSEGQLPACGQTDKGVLSLQVELDVYPAAAPALVPMATWLR